LPSATLTTRDTPHQFAIELRHGRAVRASHRVPQWVRELYGPELEKQYSAARRNRPAASFAEAREIVGAALGGNARIYIARPGGRYAGEVIGETDLHTVQKIGRHSAVAHLTHKLQTRLPVGQRATVAYDRSGRARVTRAAERAPHAAMADATRRGK
jgi:hypothetical protein